MTILNKEDTIALVAPSACIDSSKIQTYINFFENELHLKVKLATNLSKSYRYMAGTDEERAKALIEMYKDTSVKAIFVIQGNAGSSRTLNLLDYKIISQNPKPLFGLSDTTAIQNAIISQTNTTGYTGFLPSCDLKNNKIDNLILDDLKNILFENKHHIISGTCLNSGSTEGKIIGGCLVPFMYLAGTKYQPDLKDKILILEDRNEKTYKIDLIFNQIKQQKNFHQLKGIIFGQFTECQIVDDFDGTVEDCIKDFTKDLDIPIITNFSYGHVPTRHIVPLGINVKLVSSAQECSISW